MTAEAPMPPDPLSREAVGEAVARALAAADQEDYMEDWQAYDRRARAALSALCDFGGGREALEAGARSLDWFRSCGEPGSVADRKYSEIAALLRAIGGGE